MNANQHKRTIGSMMLAAAVAATTLFGAGAARAETPVRMESANIARVDELANAMKAVGKAVEPGVVSINIEKTQKVSFPRGGGGGGGMDEDMLKRMFPDNDGDGQPDLPNGFRFRFGPNGRNAPNNNNNNNNNGDNSAEDDATPDQRVYGEGSGVILDADAEKAYVLTNNHVAGDATKLTVTLSDGRRIDDVKVLGTDPLTDLAVLEIHAEGLTAVRWGDSDTLDKGDIVLAFGAPFGYVGSMTQGIVSALNRTTNPQGGSGILGKGGYEYFIQTDCAINPGNSGGPLINIHGEVVGINAAIASSSGGFNGIGLAIPSNLAQFVYQQIKETGHVTRGYLGVKIGDASALPKGQSKMLGLGSNPSGAFVSLLQNDTPASGKLQPNDVIVKMNDKPIATMQDLRLKIATSKPGSTIKLGIVRDGKPRDVEVTLGTLPGSNETVVAAQAKKNTASQQQIGAKLDDATSAQLKSLGLPGDAKGALVTGVKNGSPAFMAGLTTNDLIQKIGDKEIANATDAAAALKDAKLKDGVSMIVQTKEGTKSVFIQVEGE